MMTSSTSYRRTSSLIWASEPCTGRSQSRWPCLLRSSSTKPTGLSPSCGWLSSSFTMISPAAPAPTMSTRRAVSSLRHWVRRPSSRMKSLGRATAPTLRQPSMNRTESGTRNGVIPSAGSRAAPTRLEMDAEMAVATRMCSSSATPANLQSRR
jgi:hypothetical protein